MTTSVAEQKKRPNEWWVAVISGMASYIDSAAIVSSGTALVLYQQAKTVSATEIGVLSAALTFSIAIGALSGGRLGDLFGRRSVFLATMTMVVIGSGLLVLANGYVLLFVATVLVGLGTGADLPVSLATVSEAASDKSRGKLVSFSQVLWYGGILGTYIISSIVGGMGRTGGQIMFGAVGVIALLVLMFRLTIPESDKWTGARDEKRSGAKTLRSERVGIRDVFKQRIYLVPFLALLVFYTLTNLGANTGGQFGTYVAVNVVHISVQLNSLINLIGVPVGLLLALLFTRIADTRLRMPFFIGGAIFYVIAFGAPLVMGFSFATLIVMQFANAIGGAFAFEAIMKIWSQESFPTLLRSSVQGTIIAVARVAAGALALVTPSLLTIPLTMYAILTAVVFVGLLVGYLAFRKARFNAFTVEAKDLDEARAELREAGILRP
ncbi:MFS transporter [Frondihabitans australicus]|uniref:Inositol transporter-like SP family MFS transporter n=1 Tax=Frondihabitans australicus TaxID=386892 RepID=A0A495IJ14_9MICO|nr:MFS transporter [Frondihabitans australicus]RKR75973.1 inositol transporter-like SP family MFS transporter [Frondihabitans australicus]